jgi:hypothetical protein
VDGRESELAMDVFLKAMDDDGGGKFRPSKVAGGKRAVNTARPPSSSDTGLPDPTSVGHYTRVTVLGGNGKQ